MRTLRQVVVATASLLTLVLCVGACTGRNPDYEPSVGQVERTATIDALSLVLVTNGDRVARLIGTLVNQSDQPDRLIGLDVDAEPQGYSVVFADGPFILPEDDPLRLYRDANVTVVSEAFKPGFRADLTLVFADSEPIVTTVPVERNTGIYADVEVMRPPDGDIRPGN